MDSRQSSQSSRTGESPHHNIWQGSPSRIQTAVSWDNLMQNLSIQPSSPSESGTPNHRAGIGLPARQLSGSQGRSFPNQRTLGSGRIERLLFPEQQQPPSSPLGTGSGVPLGPGVSQIPSSGTAMGVRLRDQRHLQAPPSPHFSHSLPNQRSLPAQFSASFSHMVPLEQRSVSSYVSSSPIPLPLQRTGSGRLQLSRELQQLNARAPSDSDSSLADPPRAPTRRGLGNVDGRSASASMRILQPSSQLRPDDPPPPQPRGRIALYMTVYEGRSRASDPLNETVYERRNCSIVAQLNPRSEKFREFCCIPASQVHRDKGLRHLRFYSTPEIPNPRFSAPGLLAMYFIAWVPRDQITILDHIMKFWRRRITPEWTHFTWITLYLDLLLDGLHITDSQKSMILQRQAEALACRWTTKLPNYKWCFPHLPAPPPGR